MAESLADLNLPGFPGRQERLPGGGGGRAKRGGPQSVRARPLPDDFSPSPPPQINYRSGHAGEGAAAPRPRHGSHSQPRPPASAPGGQNQPEGGCAREWVGLGVPRGAPLLSTQEGESGAGDALKQAGQRRAPPAPRMKYRPRGRGSHGGVGAKPFPGPLRSLQQDSSRRPFPHRRSQGDSYRERYKKLGIGRVPLSVHTYACRVGFLWCFFSPRLLHSE